VSIFRARTERALTRTLLSLFALGAVATLAATAASGGTAGQQAVLSTPPIVAPPLGAGERVFPVYGNAYPSGTFGAGRGDVSGGWHHGDDIFAPLGTPVLACSDGTVFSVGWNRVGGWRLWLVDAEGNEFYYAHLSSYSAFAVDGAIVHAGDVLGYVGDTGDAEGTPYHLHFEVHPVGLLYLGYDGAVDPDPYLTQWRREKTISWQSAAGWSQAATADTSGAGAILLSARDISSASGLDPASLARVVDSAP
jgi:murein DD-endopeptidase MepM/ murein hydrolase activator NlpD